MKSFRFRLLLLVLGLVVVPLGATIYAMARKAQTAAESQAATELQAGAAVARATLAFHGEQLSLALRVLTADFGFKEAIASADRDTLLSALENHGARIHADLATAFDMDGKLLANTLNQSSQQTVAQLRASALPGADNTRIVSYRIIDGIPYQLVYATVRAPEPIAYVVMGFALNERLAMDIAQVVGIGVSFVARDQAGHESEASSSNHPDLDLRAELNAGAGARLVHNSQSGQRKFLIQREALPTSDGTLLLVMHAPLDLATSAYAQLQNNILAIGGGALLLAALLASWMTQAATRPIMTLTRAAARIEHGDYNAIAPISDAPEFSQLSSAFAAMRDAVADREQRILHQSQHDELTGLLNRTAMCQSLRNDIEQHTPHGKSIAVCLIDLIQFSDINAALGHAVGDEALREIAQRLQRNAPMRSVVGRHGAKQFLVLLPDLTQADAMKLARQMLEVIQQPLMSADVPIQLHARCGIALFPAHGATAENLLRRADLALLNAQQSDIRVAVFNPDTEVSHQRRIQVLGDLQRGIEENQLRLVYQPKMDVRTRAIVSCEVLVRWQHPVHGNIPPSEFIPHAERTGAIRQLTDWVLDTALAQLAEWSRNGRHIELAVNLSAADIADATLPHTLINLLQRHGVAGQQLILEITESTVMQHIDTVLSAISSLHACGIRFSIDDFGTGHSSLAQLRRLPVDELKLEGSLIADMAQEERARMIVRAMTELGHSLGMRVVAEGVENIQLLRAISRSGCDIAQGYLIAKPMSATQLVSWLDQQPDAGQHNSQDDQFGLTARVLALRNA